MIHLLAIGLLAAPALRVVVYPDRAQVTRAASATCGKGTAAVVFDDLTPAADATSFRALSPDAAVLGVRTELRAQTQAFRPEAEALDGEIRKLEGEARRLDDARRRAEKRMAVAGSYSDLAATLVSREMVQPGADAKAWALAFDGSLASRQKASADSLAAATELRDVTAQLHEKRRRRERMRVAMARQSYRAEVLLGCEQGQPAHAELSYLVGGAGWEPTYEARADEKSGKVALAMLATVHQATGEEWKRAAVILSTALPRSDATPPELATLRVGAAERKAEKKVLVRRDEEQRHAEAAAPGEAPAGEGMEAAAQGLSVQLKVKAPADLSGDGTPARLFVGSHELNATFAYRTIPKLMPYVFRVADLVNTAPFPLLPGPIDAYRASGFIARTPLERVAEGARFHLTFGVEENVKVKRIVVEELQKDAGLFGNNKRFHYKYRFELTSHLKRAEQIELGDHVPVSELDDVKVELDDKTTAGAKVQADDGLVNWKVDLKPGEKRNVDFAFHVDVPGSYDSGGL